MGQLVFQATLGGQVNLVGPNTASTFNINVPATAGNMVTTGDTGTVTNTMLASTTGSGAVVLASAPTISGNLTLSGGTANGVTYLNGSKVVTSGSALTFDGSNLGIGTNSPGSVLDVIGSGNPTLTLRGSAGAYSSILKLQAASGGTSIINATGATADVLAFQITGTEKMRLDTSGNLLVGTTSTSGVLSNTTKIVGGSFTTRQATTASLANAATEDITGLISGAAYTVVCRGDSNTTTFVIQSVYVNGSGGITLGLISNGNSFVLTSPSNNTLRVTGLVTTQTYTYSLTRIF
jgi:hypothetical protein